LHALEGTQPLIDLPIALTRDENSMARRLYAPKTLAIPGQKHRRLAAKLIGEDREAEWRRASGGKQ
jgi:hypothetical protein